MKRRKQLLSTDLSINHIRYEVGDKVEFSNSPLTNEVKVAHFSNEDKAEDPDPPTSRSEADILA